MTDLYDTLKNAGLPVISANDGEAVVMGEMTAEQKDLYERIVYPPSLMKQTEQIFYVPVVAPDFIVQSPKPKTDPLQALTEAIEEAAKADKSVALIVLDLVKYLEEVEKRLKKAKV